MKENLGSLIEDPRSPFVGSKIILRSSNTESKKKVKKTLLNATVPLALGSAQVYGCHASVHNWFIDLQERLGNWSEPIEQ